MRKELTKHPAERRVMKESENSFFPLHIRLQQELVNRCRRNSKYSLRSFAQSLGVPVSTLSRIIKNETSVNEKTLLKISTALCFEGDELKFYLRDRISKSNRIRKKKIHSSNFHFIDFDIFETISNWYYFAILELLKIKSLKQSSSHFSKLLGITPNVVKIAIERLKKVNLIEENDKGYFRVVKRGNSFFLNRYTNEAYKKLHICFLEKAIESIKQIPLEKRDNTGVTIAISTKDIPMVKKKIEQFRRELSEELDSNPNPDSVYQLIFGFFPLTKDISE